MFKKKPTVKSLAPMRSSDCRRTADQLLFDLELESSISDEASDEEKAAFNAAHIRLRNSILPENSLSARFTATSGPELKQVSGIIYVGSHDGEGQRILWVRIEGVMYPTVYTLWHNPGMIPLLHTWSIVMGKIQGGADLMVPGLCRGPPFPIGAKKNAIVAIASEDKPSVPMAVGTCEIDVGALEEIKGIKGHAVKVIHWLGDGLCAWSPARNDGGVVPDHLMGWDSHDQTGLDELIVQADNLYVKNEEDGGNSIQVKEEVQKSTGQIEYSTKQIDEAFRDAFIYGVFHKKKTNKSKPNFDFKFPLSQSFVMSNLVQPFLPTNSVRQTAAFQIKKTSWKNLKRFIKSLDKDNLVKSKERDGNQIVIVDIDFNNPEIMDFTPYPLQAQGSSVLGMKKPSDNSEDKSADGYDDSIGQTLKVLELYQPQEKLAPLFTAYSAAIPGFFTAKEIRDAIKNYINAEKLLLLKSKRLVGINSVLRSSVIDGSEQFDDEVVANGFVPQDVLLDRIFTSGCNLWYSITRDHKSNESEVSPPIVKPKPGPPPKIKIVLEIRGSNKTATKVSGVEAFFINPQPLADELRKLCASSTHVERLIGTSPKNLVMEIMVQGRHHDAVSKALARRGVSGKWTDVLDKTKGKSGKQKK